MALNADDAGKSVGTVRPVTTDGFAVGGGWLVGMDVDGTVIGQATGVDPAIFGPPRMRDGNHD